MTRSSEILRAIVVGAVSYVLLVYFRSEIYAMLHLSRMHPVYAPVDATAIYLVCMLSGFVAARLTRTSQLTTGLLANLLGEICRVTFKYFIAAYSINFLAYPPHFIADVLLAPLPVGLLGAAGAAFAVAWRARKDFSNQVRESA